MIHFSLGSLFFVMAAVFVMDYRTGLPEKGKNGMYGKCKVRTWYNRSHVFSPHKTPKVINAMVNTRRSLVVWLSVIRHVRTQVERNNTVVGVESQTLIRSIMHPIITLIMNHDVVVSSAPSSIQLLTVNTPLGCRRIMQLYSWQHITSKLLY